MQNTNRLILAALLFTGVNSDIKAIHYYQEAMNNNPGLDETLKGCAKSDQFSQCVAYCGSLNLFLKDAVTALESLKETLEKEKATAQDDATINDINDKLAAIAEKMKFYKDSQQRCYATKQKGLLY